MSEYNGHPSREHWNVSLWLHNDEPLYRLVQAAVKDKTRDEAARYLLKRLPRKRTPDGVVYTFELVLYAIGDEWKRAKKARAN